MCDGGNIGRMGPGRGGGGAMWVGMNPVELDAPSPGSSGL